MTSERWTWIGAVLAVLAAGLLLLLPTDTLFTHVVMDDAYYYVRIPLNIVDGYGVSYDQVSQTNGFHPLWALLLLPLGLLPDGAALWGALLLSWGFIALGAASLVDLSRSLRWGAVGGLVAVAAYVFPRADLYLSLMESGPSAALLLAGVALGTRRQWMTSDRWSDAVFIGLWLAAIFLVRLDFAFIVVAMAVALILARWRSGQALGHWLRRLSLSGVVAAIPALLYIASNQLRFGHMTPVSGRKKHVALWELDSPVEQVLHLPLAVGRKLGVDLGGTLLLMAVGGLVLGVGVLWGRRALRDSALRPRLFAEGMVLPLLVGTLGRAVYMRTFMAVEANRVPWYWVPLYVCAAILAGYAAGLMAASVRARRPALGAALPVAALVLLWPAGTLFQLRDNYAFSDPWPSPTLDAADWAAENLAPDARCAMYDSGLMSWRSGHPCVSLNGLIGDERMMELSLAKDFGTILREYDVDVYAEYCTQAQADRAGAGLLYRSEGTVPPGMLPWDEHYLCLFDVAVYNPYDDPAWVRPFDLPRELRVRPAE